MTPRPLRTILPLVVVALLGVACSSSTKQSAGQDPSTPPSSAAVPSAPGSSTTSPATASPAPPAATGAMITIKDFAYAVPASVPPGAEVKVVNKDGEAHTVTVAGGSKVVVQGGSTGMLRAPMKAGTYKLSCDFHGNMHADLLVS